MANHRYCDGVARRDFLKVGVLGASAAGGISVADLLRAQAAEKPAAGSNAKQKSGIMVYLGGGPTHMDTFDLKPNAPDENRGEFKPIETNVPGVQICEHLPKLAKCADKYTILRGVSHTLAAHELGTLYMNTGNRPLPSLRYPGYGAVVSKELKTPPDLPPFVAVPGTPMEGGYLGVRYAPLKTNSTPKSGQPFTVRGVSLGRGLTVEQVDRRQDLLNDVDTAFAGYEKASELVTGLDEFSKQAYNMISSPKARKAFDVSQESADVTKLFGTTDFSMSCLLATRLIEAGVRFVTVSLGGWDTHQNNFEQLKNGKLAVLDEGLAGLFTTLAAKGLLDTTSVMVAGEFGRTPKINERAGRDHWPRAMFTLLGGGGIKGGQVLGASDEKGMGPAGDAITPDQIAASFFKSLGIDHHKEYHTNTGRPIMIVRNGEPIRELFA